MTDAPTFTAMAITQTFLTYDQAAAVLGISRSTLERIVARRELAIVRIGGRPRVLEEHLREYVERQTLKAASP